MHLRDLRLMNFKSWEEASFLFHPKLNAWVGANGSGKTNLLDAIHFLSLSKSYFASADAHLIRHGADFLTAEGSFVKGEAEYRIHGALKKGQKKTFRHNQKEYEKLSDHIGRFPSVVISPYDRDLIVESSETRRRFLDRVLSQGDAQYLFHLQRYNRALQQRNRLLKYFASNHQFSVESLEAFDQQLCEHGQALFEKRQHFAQSLQPIISRYYRWISGEQEEADLQYRSSLTENDLAQELRAHRDRDRLLQYTGVGPHRDDLLFRLQGRSVRRYGSQGQQKTYLIALKLAQYDFIRQQVKTPPLLLLDDIFDKLDEKRVDLLVQLVHDEEFGQIFITDTHPERTEGLVKAMDESAEIFTLGQ